MAGGGGGGGGEGVRMKGGCTFGQRSVYGPGNFFPRLLSGPVFC